MNKEKNINKINFDVLEKEISKLNKCNRFLQTKQIIHHGTTSIFSHCYSVALNSLIFTNKLNIKNIDYNSMIKGAMLHDYFLYDWHTHKPQNIKENHAFCHAIIAERNAIQDFNLSNKEKNIIKSHMFPLNPFIIPTSKEAWVVCLMDKYCALIETICGFFKKAKGILIMYKYKLTKTIGHDEFELERTK